jgi:hypothetical protein
MKHSKRRLVVAFAVIAAAGGAASVVLFSAEDGAREPRSSDTGRDRFAKLRARSVRVPHLGRGGECRLSPRLSAVTTLQGIPAEAGLGKGPIYVAFPGIPRVLDLRAHDSAKVTDSGWRKAEILVVSEPAYVGAVLIRGRQIDGPNRLAFGGGIQPDPELRLPSGPREPWRNRLRAWGDRIVHPPQDWRVAAADTRIETEGCYLLQLDGESFSQTIGFFTALQP